MCNGRKACVCGIQNVQRDSELSINDPLSVSYGDIKCLLWSARRVHPLAELNQAERSEAPPREARLPPKAACAGGAPEPREGFRVKLGCDLTGRDSAAAR